MYDASLPTRALKPRKLKLKAPLAHLRAHAGSSREVQAEEFGGQDMYSEFQALRGLADVRFGPCGRGLRGLYDLTSSRLYLMLVPSGGHPILI